MVFIVSIILIIFILFNIISYRNIMKLTLTNTSAEQVMKNTNSFWIKVLFVLFINLALIILIPISENLFFSNNHSQELIDYFATMGFILFFVLCIILSFLLYRKRKYISFAHSSGFIAILALEISAIIMLFGYYIFI